MTLAKLLQILAGALGNLLVDRDALNHDKEGVEDLVFRGRRAVPALGDRHGRAKQCGIATVPKLA